MHEVDWTAPCWYTHVIMYIYRSTVFAFSDMSPKPHVVNHMSAPLLV